MSRRTRRSTITAALVAILLVTQLTAQAAAPSVAIASLNGQAVSGGSVRKAIKGSTLTVTGNAETTRPVVADAGDSVFVKAGEPITTAGLAWFGRAPYAYRWSFDGTSTRFADPTRPTTTFDTANLPEGPLTLTLTVTDSRGQTAVDTVKNELFVDHFTSLLTQTQTTGASFAGVTSDEESAGKRFPFDVPADAISLHLELSWQQSYKTGVVDFRGYDLKVDDPSDREDANVSGAGFTEPEKIDIGAPAAGGWSAIVQSSVNLPDQYTVTASAIRRRANPVPTVSVPSPVRFVVGEEQRVVATVSGGKAPLVTAWDTDFDGVFESPGAAVVTHFGVGTNLITVKTTDSNGFEKRVTVPVRVVLPGTSTAAPLVVVGVTDTGINPYHADFAASSYPDQNVLDLTANFTRHPSEYIPGYPAGTSSIPVTLGQGYLPGADANLWTRANIHLNTLYWIPGTKIIGAIDGGDTDTNDVKPILDDDYAPTALEGPGHGTASASVAVGNVFGFCSTCLLVFNEDISGNPGWPYQQPWIDIVSNSYGARGNVGDVGTGTGLLGEPMPKAAAERGQLGLYAAGNGYENAFITPEQTYTSDDTGPDWVVRVGAAERGTRKPVVGTGKPVSITSWGAGNIPAARWSGATADDTTQHSGTSAATPYTAGVFATVLRAAREALGDIGAGQRGAPTSGIIATGKPILDSPYLKDGTFTLAELKEVVLKTAEHDTGSNFAIVPTTTPNTPGQFLVEGYGIAEPASAQRAIDVMLHGAALPDRSAEDAFFGVDSQLRQALWGTWSGGGTNSAAAPTGASSTPNPFAGVTAAALPNLAATLKLMAARTGPLTEPAAAASAAAQLAGTGDTYFLHHLGGCADGATPGPFMDLANTDGDDDGCGAAGLASAAGAAIESFTSTAATTTTIPVGSSVAGTIYLETDAPGQLTVRADLIAGGQVVGTGTSEAVLSAGLVGGWSAFPISFTTSAPIAVGARPTLAVGLDTSVSWYFGYEGDHASSFTVIPGGDSGGGAGTLGATITSPAAGTSIDPAAVPSLAVMGTATFPKPPAAVQETTYYPHWASVVDPTTGNSTCTTQSLDRSPDSADSSCAQTLQVLAATGVAEFRESYAVGGGDLPITLDGTTPVNGTIFYKGNVPSPVHQITVQLRTKVNGADTTIGEQTVSGTILDVLGALGPTAFAFSFVVDPLYAGIPRSSLSLDVVTNSTTSVSMARSGQSFVKLPLAGATGPGAGTVQVAVDDPGFVHPVIATQGTDGTWGSTVDTTALVDGNHTIAARAVQDGKASAPASVTVQVKRAALPPSDMVQVQVVPSGVAPIETKWTDAADLSSDKDFSAWTAQVSIASIKKGNYDVYARLVQKGAQTAITGPVHFKRA